MQCPIVDNFRKAISYFEVRLREAGFISEAELVMFIAAIDYNKDIGEIGPIFNGYIVKKRSKENDSLKHR